MRDTDDTAAPTGYENLFTHEPQSFTGPDAEKIRAFFTGPRPPRPAPIPGITFLHETASDSDRR